MLRKSFIPQVRLAPTYNYHIYSRVHGRVPRTLEAVHARSAFGRATHMVPCAPTAWRGGYMHILTYTCSACPPPTSMLAAPELLRGRGGFAGWQGRWARAFEHERAKNTLAQASSCSSAHRKSCFAARTCLPAEVALATRENRRSGLRAT